MAVSCGMFLERLIRWYVSLISENIVLSRESGENVTLKCFSAGCLSINEGYGMYLYHDFSSKEEVFYYYSSGSNEKITPRERYKNRIQTNGSLENHTVTITDLTVDDSGIYSCVYKDVTTVHCNVYTLCVRGVFFFFLLKNCTTSSFEQ